MSGLGVSLATGILLISLLGSLTIILPTIQSINQQNDQIENRRKERELIKGRTKIEIVYVNVRPNEKVIDLDIKNTGHEKIRDISNLSVFTNGESGEWLPLTSSPTTGWSYIITPTSLNPLFWDPDENVSMTIRLTDRMSVGTYFILVSTTNGVTDIYQWDHS